MTRTWRTILLMLFGFFLFYLMIFLFVTSSTNMGAAPGTDSIVMEQPKFESSREQNGLLPPQMSSRMNNVAKGPLELEGPCSKFKRKLDLLILILSDSYDEKGRDLIRATYGGLQRFGEFYTMSYFLVDVSNGVLEEASLISEMKINNDISFYISEFSMSGTESLSFNISNFPKTDNWVKSCLQNSNVLLYFEHIQQLQLEDLVETILTSPNYVVPSASPPSSMFIASSSSLYDTIGAKTADWGVYIPNNLDRFYSQIPASNTNIQQFFLPRPEGTSNLTADSVPELFRSLLITGYQSGESELVFNKLRIESKYSKRRPKTVEPSACRTRMLPGGRPPGGWHNTVRVLLFVDSQIKRFPQRDSIRKTFGKTQFVERKGHKMEVFVRFLASQYKYLLFKPDLRIRQTCPDTHSGKSGTRSRKAVESRTNTKLDK
ncbi:uncharacterized protein LOC134851210 isoform X3 [Symsagittifera roscoffensis]|uniref:uncharacterized protein LOC134851210 isoform X3 n=1 Tax=Symsagittifera roscoffensis TaxID=84072 RepID=UPI00307CC379